MLTLLLPEYHYYTNTLVHGPCYDVILHRVCVGVVRLLCMRMGAFSRDVMPCSDTSTVCGRPDDTHAGACGYTMWVPWSACARDYRATDRVAKCSSASLMACGRILPIYHGFTSAGTPMANISSAIPRQPLIVMQPNNHD